MLSMHSMAGLFVYGTLLRHECNHAVLSDLEGVCFIRRVRTDAIWTLRDLGPYPALCSGGTDSILGELYEVPDRHFAILDAFEGSEYRRGVLTLVGDVEAFGYIWLGNDLGTTISSGDWRNRR